MKRAIFFSLDALIALAIILITVLIVYPEMKYEQKDNSLNEDIIKVLSSVKVAELDDPYIMQLKAEGKISENKSVLEQIGEFFITNLTIARNIGEIVLADIPPEENIGLWYGDTLIASRNITSLENSKNIEVERQYISGIRQGESVTGFSARAFLISSLQKNYFYFGGYVGEGNISALVDLNYASIENFEMELVTNRDFKVYINGEFSGYYQNSSSVYKPARYDLSAYRNKFVNGENIIKLVGVGGNLYIAGGYTKITYEDTTQYRQAIKYYFPGIEGLVNIYDGFYIPGQLSEMEISLHYKSNYTMFLNIGNVTVYNGSSGIETIKTINNIELSSKLNYASLINKTIPLRLGLENVSYVTTETRSSDVVSVTDLSGSMASTCNGGGWFCCIFAGGCSNSQTACESCGGTFVNKIQDAKDSNKEFINSLLNNTQNRVGFVGYDTDARAVDYFYLTQDNNSLITFINNRPTRSFTCICCGINRGIAQLIDASDPRSSDSNIFRSVVVMSDGEANMYCSGYNDFTGTSGDNAQARQDTIDSSCYAWNNYGIRVYTVGFDITPGSLAETTLISAANCGNGTYYNASVDNLIQIYQQIAQDILEAAYKEQTIETTANVSIILYPDSYIKLNYTKETLPYGLITTTEKQFDDHYFGSFSVPAGSKILETRAISYSGPRWTDSVIIHNMLVYKLATYGQDYTQLGDPYSINIPSSAVSENNIVNITTGLSPTNVTFGSEYNKIIYTLVRDILTYSPIVVSADGCNWEIEFEDGSILSVKIPENYSGVDNCYYKSSGVFCVEEGVEKNCLESKDAIKVAVYKLLDLIDLNKNNMTDIKFAEQDLKVDFSETTGIPFPWATEVQVRKWE